MIELLVAVIIFGLAMVPLMWMSTRTTSHTYSIGKHMMAGQIAASLLDRLMALKYNDCCNMARKLSKENKAKVMDDKEFIAILKLANDKNVEKDMKRSFKNFKYQVTLTEDKKTKTARIDVMVYYQVTEGNPKTEQSVELSAIKFGVING